MLVVAIPLSFGKATEVVWTLSAGGHVQSTGESMDDRFYFELGGFADGFSPTASNFSAWSSMWTPLARKRFSPGGDTVIQGEVLEEFSEGAPGYVWAFNVDEPTREWALLSDMSWTWPESVGEGRVDWGVTGVTVALLGQWNGAMLTTAPVGLAEDPVTTPREWKASFFVAPALLNNPLISGWNADPDGDGLENLIEMAVGAHPLLPNPQQEGLPVGSTVSVSNGVVPVLRFQKKPELLLDYGVAASDGSTTILRNDLREIVGQGESLLKNQVLSTLSLTVTLDATE